MPNAAMYDLLSLDHQRTNTALREQWTQALLATNPLALWAHYKLVLDPGAYIQVGVAKKIDIPPQLFFMMG